jgi:hypothetical protein
VSDSPLDRVRYVAVRNTYSAEVPAYGIMQITGCETSAGVLVLTVTRPTTTGDSELYLINSGRPIAAGAQGFGTFDLPHRLLWDSGLSAPVFGETWGPQQNSFTARRGPVYYKVYGTAPNGTIYVGPAKPKIYLAKSPGGGIPAMSGTTPGSATCDVWEMVSTTIAVTSRQETVYNLSLTAVGASKQIQCKQEIRTGRILCDWEDCT